MIANWAGNVRFQPRRMHRPRSMDELRRALHGHERVRVVGSAHSFTDVADTEGVLIDLAEMPRGLDVDSAGRRARVSGGWTYGDLCPRLHEAGWALDNLASLPHVSVAGACATATHGSGRRLGCLATQIEEVELLTADGEVVTLAHGAERFPAAAVSLGALGIVTALTLRVRPAFSMIQHVHERVPLDALAAELEATMTRAYSVCLFTAWEDQPHADAWVKRVVADGAAATDEETDADPLFGVPAASRDRHPQPEGSADACTEQRTVGPWHVRLPHFRPDRTPASGDELQTEYFVPWENASRRNCRGQRPGRPHQAGPAADRDPRRCGRPPLAEPPSAAAIRWPSTSPGATTGRRCGPCCRGSKRRSRRTARGPTGASCSRTRAITWSTSTARRCSASATPRGRSTRRAGSATTSWTAGYSTAEPSVPAHAIRSAVRYPPVYGGHDGSLNCHPRLQFKRTTTKCI